MSFKIKMVCGFRKDQEYSVDAEEAHKAYYLFLNPSARGVFANGLAITGAQIQSIVPDYHGTMGWNASHTLDSDDWNEIRAKGIEGKLRDLLYAGKEIATRTGNVHLGRSVSELMQDDFKQLAA